MTELNLINITQASEQTGIPRITLIKQAARGDIPGATKLGNQWVMPRSALRTIRKRRYERRGAAAIQQQ